MAELGALTSPAASGEFSPIRVMEAELAGPLPGVPGDGRDHDVWVLARLHTEPVGSCTLHAGPGGLSPAQLAQRLWPEVRQPVGERFAAAGLPEPRALTADGLTADPRGWPFLCRRAAALAAAPFISVVLATRDRPAQLANCLDHLELQDYPGFEILVVENVPAGETVANLVRARHAGVTYRYLAEPRSGLSWARNTGTAAASGEIVAFIDDDDEPDRYWLAGLACGFTRGTDVGCVTGPVVPAALDTPAQALFEQLGGHSKGRGLVSADFRREGPQNPLFPLPLFGTGANMAFRREALAHIGGFDVALGAGTPALAGAETLAFTLTLLAGYRIAYEPAALMRHHHRRDFDGLRRQLYGYSVGLTAYYAALLRHQPDVIPGLLRLAPRAAGYLRGTAAARAAVPAGSLAALDRRHLRGMLAGPLAYLKSRRIQARVADRVALP